MIESQDKVDSNPLMPLRRTKTNTKEVKRNNTWRRKFMKTMTFEGLK